MNIWDTLQHGWISNLSGWVEDTILKRLHTILLSYSVAKSYPNLWKHTLYWLYLYTILENTSKSVVTESRSVVAWRWAEKWYCCRSGHPFQGLKGCSCLTLGIELSKETGVVRTLETSLARGAWAESRRVREPRRTTVSCGTQPLVLWWWG